MKVCRLVEEALRKGYLVMQPCEVCSSIENVEAHHDNYAYPLEVRWLCRRHHIEWHRDNGPGLNGGD